jgi:hypothetical protein
MALEQEKNKEALLYEFFDLFGKGGSDNPDFFHAISIERFQHVINYWNIDQW